MERSDPRRRTAVGIAGVAREGIGRGSVLVAAGDPWYPTAALDVTLALDSTAPRGLAHRARIRVHLGTAEVIGRVLPRGPIDPGGQGTARIALEAPVIARGGDRFVVRSFSPVTTIGGGTVLDPNPPVRRAVWPANLGAADQSERLVALVERRVGALDAGVLPVLLGASPARARAMAEASPSLRLVGDLWVLAGLLESLATQCLESLRHYHRDHPLELGMPLETLRRALRAPGPAVEAVLEDMIRKGRTRPQGAGLLALTGFAPRAAGGEAAVNEVVRLVQAAGLTPPTVSELERQTGRRDVGAILRLAARAGRVEPVEPARYYSKEALDQVVRALQDGEGDEVVVPSELRRRLGITRKYLIPLLEWADTKGFTAWQDGVRRVRLDRPA
jgi:selenocysteine-specific elongation factor